MIHQRINISPFLVKLIDLKVESITESMVVQNFPRDLKRALRWEDCDPICLSQRYLRNGNMVPSRPFYKLGMWYNKAHISIR